MIIYHNPRCRKSRETLEIIKNNGVNPEIVEYLVNPLNSEELKSVLQKLNLQASQIIRKGEVEFKEHFKGKELNENQWIQALVDFPKLMERPIVVKGNKAVIGRPPENVNEIL